MISSLWSFFFFLYSIASLVGSNDTYMFLLAHNNTNKKDSSHLIVDVQDITIKDLLPACYETKQTRYHHQHDRYIMDVT